jgi:hypothetical protein
MIRYITFCVFTSVPFFLGHGKSRFRRISLKGISVFSLNDQEEDAGTQKSLGFGIG